MHNIDNMNVIYVCVDNFLYEMEEKKWDLLKHSLVH